MSDWWNSLSLEKKKEYLKEHPGSKRKLTPSKGGKSSKPVAKKASNEETSSRGKKPNPAVLSKAMKYNVENKDILPKKAEPTLQNMEKTYTHRLKSMSEQQRRKFTREVKSAVRTKDRGKLRKVSKKVGIMTGILLVGGVGLSMVTGVDMTMSVEAMAAGFWEDIDRYASNKEVEAQAKHQNKQIKAQETKDNKREAKHQRQIEDELRMAAELKRKDIDNTAYLKNVGTAYVNKIRENIQNPEEVNKALVESDSPDVVIDDVERDEVASISIMSNHETDLTKAMIRVEKLEIASQTESILNASVDETADSVNVTAHKLIDHAETIETVIPSIASIFVSSISQKSSLANRAKTQLSIFNRELARCKEELVTIGNRQSMHLKKTPLNFVLKKNIRAEGYSYEVSYVKCENKNIRLCELHTFTGVDVAGFKVNKVEVYGYMDNNDLHVAVTRDSNFTPKAFNVIKPRNLVPWLVENGVSS